MSDPTKQALDKAIEAFVEAHADEPGTMVTGYVLQTTYTTAQRFVEGRTAYMRTAAEGQPLTTTLGIARYAAIKIEQHVEAR